MSRPDRMRMTRAGIVARLRHDVGLSRTDAVDCLETVLTTIHRSLVAGDDVRLTGFGQFSVRQRAGRMGVHPATGAPVEHKPRRVVSFKPARGLKELIDHSSTGQADASSQHSQHDLEKP